VSTDDLTHKIETRMYSRTLRGMTELFFVDRTHLRAVAQAVAASSVAAR
jgi:hypothetical protein